MNWKDFFKGMVMIAAFYGLNIAGLLYFENAIIKACLFVVLSIYTGVVLIVIGNIISAKIKAKEGKE